MRQRLVHQRDSFLFGCGLFSLIKSRAQESIKIRDLLEIGDLGFDLPGLGIDPVIFESAPAPGFAHFDHLLNH